MSEVIFLNSIDELLRHVEANEDVIEPAGDTATIYSHPDGCGSSSASPRERRPLLVMHPGESLVGHVFHCEETESEWLISAPEIRDDHNGISGIGYAVKNEVQVTARQRKIPLPVTGVWLICG
jgi:hypothetical protein